MNKRLFGILILSVFAVLTLNSVSAAEASEAGKILGSFFVSVANGIGGFLAGLFGEVNLGSANLSVLLLGLLLWMILYSVVDKIFMPERTSYMGWNIFPVAVSLIITLLSMILIPDDFINAIVLQYGIMGATILTVLPFIIMLYFTVAVSRSLIISRIIWTFYIIYYFTIFAYKMVEIGSWDRSLIPYSAAIVGGIIIFFFIAPIRKLAFRGELDSKEEQAIRDVNFRNLGRRIEREETRSRVNTK